MKIPEDLLVKFITMFYEMELDGTMSGPQGQVRLMRFIENVWNDGFNVGIPVLSKGEAHLLSSTIIGTEVQTQQREWEGEVSQNKYGGYQFMLKAFGANHAETCDAFAACLSILNPENSSTDKPAGFASEEAILLKDNPEDWRHVEPGQLSKQHEDNHGDFECTTGNFAPDNWTPDDGWSATESWQ